MHVYICFQGQPQLYRLRDERSVGFYVRFGQSRCLETDTLRKILMTCRNRGLCNEPLHEMQEFQTVYHLFAAKPKKRIQATQEMNPDQEFK